MNVNIMKEFNISDRYKLIMQCNDGFEFLINQPTRIANTHVLTMYL